MLSRQLATLDVLSGGRITAGIGLGGSAEEFRRMRGDLPSPNRGKMMDEFVPALRVLWEESKATYSGQYVNFQDIEAYPKPVQSPLPIFMAGQADGVLRRLARYGQGWIDTTLLPDAIKEIAGQISFYPAQAGRDGSDIEITRQFYISLATSKEEAEANLAASLPGAKQAAAAQPARPIEMTLVGTPAESAPRLRAYMGTGVTEICAIFYSPTVESALRQMELFVRDVIPRVARLREVVAACGLELTCGLAVADDSYDEQIVAGFSLRLASGSRAYIAPSSNRNEGVKSFIRFSCRCQRHSDVVSATLMRCAREGGGWSLCPVWAVLSLPVVPSAGRACRGDVDARVSEAVTA